MGLHSDTPSWTVRGYEAVELIGFGASGEVWRGRSVPGGDVVALKRLHGEGVSDAAARAALRREADLLAALDHPHLLRMRELVSTAAAEVLVLDYAAGGSLATLLRARGRLDPGEVVTAIAPVAAALAYAHNEDLVHGDVAPGNILFSADGRPLLADLGVARVGADDDVARLTPEYADPAVARGGPPAAASDVFAIAAVAFHALTGVPPWNAATVEDTLAVAADGEPPDLAELAPGVPPGLLEIVMRGLADDPAERGSAAEFALDLRYACPAEPVRLPAGQSVVPRAARAAALTHGVGRRPGTGPAGRAEAAPDGARHRAATPTPVRRLRHRLTGRSLWRPAGRVRLRSVLAGLAAIAGIVLAGVLGVAWAGGSVRPDASPSTVSGPNLPLVGPSSTVGSSPAPPSSTGPTPPASPSRPPRPPTPSRPESPPPTSDAPRPDATADGWRPVLARLDAARAAAFARADAGGLADVYAARSPAAAADATTLRRLAARAQRVRGARHVVHSVQVVRAGSQTAVVQAVEALAAYDVVAADGSSARYPAGAARTYRIELVATRAGWRISTISGG
ncbi:MAG: protein kinase domain-containing protein [Mycobacteriales bacterium]|nr:MAG: serine/threonine protein kinase [Pseudonocardiales bacterium]